MSLVGPARTLVEKQQEYDLPEDLEELIDEIREDLEALATDDCFFDPDCSYEDHPVWELPDRFLLQPEDFKNMHDFTTAEEDDMLQASLQIFQTGHENWHNSTITSPRGFFHTQLGWQHLDGQLKGRLEDFVYRQNRVVEAKDTVAGTIDAIMHQVRNVLVAMELLRAPAAPPGTPDRKPGSRRGARAFLSN